MVPPEAVSVVGCVGQTIELVGETEMFGIALTMIVFVAIPTHPFAFVAVTVYVVVAEGETEIAVVVCPPGDQK